MFGIIAATAPKPTMVHFKVGSRSTELALPSVALEYLLAELVVGLSFEPDPRTLWGEFHQLAFEWCTSARNSCCCACGKNL